MCSKVKKIRILLAAVLVALLPVLSCERLPEVDPAGVPGDEPEEQPQEEEKVTVEFRISSSPDSRATGIVPSDESRVNRWALYLFDRSTGARVGAVSSVASDSPIAKAVSPGTYIACAVVNYPTSGTGSFTLTSVSTQSDLESKVMYLPNNGLSSLVMYGYDEITLAAGDNGTKNINVSRLVTKLGIKKVTVNMSRPSDVGRTFVLKGIYVTNAYSRCKLGEDYASFALSSTRSYWYNAMGWHASGSCSSPACPDVLLGDTSINQTIANGSSHSTPHYFYAFPNAAASDSHNSRWSIRRTRIVIEGSIDGTTYYYQVNLPATVRNNTYTVENAVITKLGSTDPEQEVTDALDVVFSTSADAWDGPVTVPEDS